MTIVVYTVNSTLITVAYNNIFTYYFCMGYSEVALNIVKTNCTILLSNELGVPNAL